MAVCFFSGNAYGLHVWNVSNGELAAIIPGTDTYGRMSVFPDQRLVVIDSWGSQLSLWGIRTGQ